MAADETTLRVIYSGRVQGVGFRWNAREIARRFPVVGYVCNLPDGTVELVVRGAPDRVREYLDAVARRFRNHMTGSDIQPIVLAEELESFDIRH